MTVEGFVEAGFEGVRSAFQDNFENRNELGAAFAAVLDGRPVVDLWGGIADEATNRAWQEHTLQLVFSGTKGFVAVCLLQLIERGELDLDAAVCEYWPEFAAGGKEAITVRHVVSHGAGLPGLRQPIGFDDIAEPARMAALLSVQQPFWPAGEVPCYHGLTYGWLCGELVRRIDGRTIGRFFADEVAGPLGLELWIGLPAELEPRVSRVRRASTTAPPLCIPGSPEWSVEWNPPLWHGDPDVWNSRRYHASEIPGAGAIGSARSIARLYGCLARGGELDGVRVLAPETIELGRTELARGTNPIGSWPLAFGVGFALPTAAREFGPSDSAFGHGGAGGSMHGAWPEKSVGFSYVMNDMREDRARADTLLAALDKAVSTHLSVD
jgi:CubicO group peptidase (beta-lactamase class C family)